MEVRQLQIFCTLAEELNFTRTAERVALTDAGRRFLPFAAQALAVMEQGQRTVQAGSEPCGPLRIGAPESVLTYRLPPVLRDFRRRFPHVELIFRPHADDGLAIELETGKIDMVIHMGDCVPNSAFECIPLRTERIFLLCHPSHPLARQRTVKPSDLAGQTLLLTEAGCGYRAKLDRTLAMQNIRPGHVTEFSSVEAIKQCVAAAMGLALLPAIVVARELRQHQFKALHWAGPPLDIATQILWHKDKWVSPAMAAFRDMVKASLDEPEIGEPRLVISGSFER